MKTENKRRLSEVMRAGAALRPQGFGGLFCKAEGETHSCALGAVYESAFGFQPWAGLEAQNMLKLRFPILKETVQDPITGDEMPLGWAIIYLNDSWLWTREQIADFVEKCECEEASKDLATDRFLAHREPEPVLT